MTGKELDPVLRSLYPIAELTAYRSTSSLLLLAASVLRSVSATSAFRTLPLTGRFCNLVRLELACLEATFRDYHRPAGPATLFFPALPEGRPPYPGELSHPIAEATF
jgi:hypothetical protein